MALAPALLSVLACPQDKGPLLYFADEGFLYNPRLRRKYPITNDIPNFLDDAATVADDAEAARLEQKAKDENITPGWEQTS
ncbi:MAG TPA: Trm112 family protein [Acidimicrobiales bacterium]|nr:Trm112 family protein [Acidimicrobiales bacterium]